MTWWQQANGFEVYALHALFLPLVTLLFLRWVDSGRARVRAHGAAVTPAGESAAAHAGGFAAPPATGPDARRGAAFALVLGLSFTNHMTTVLLAPAFLVYFFAATGAGRAAWARLLGLAPWFALGLLPYLWLPLRARMHPRFDWGDPDTFHRFFAHVSAWQFRVWMFTDPDTFRRQTAWFFRQLPGDLSTVGLLAALLGLALLLRARARLGVFALLLFAATILYAGNYQIRDVAPYYMTAILALGMCGAAGLLLVRAREQGRALFVTREVSKEIGARWHRIPVQLALELRPDSSYAPLRALRADVRLRPARAGRPAAAARRARDRGPEHPFLRRAEGFCAAQGTGPSGVDACAPGPLTPPGESAPG